MQIRSMSEASSIELVRRVRFGHLACCDAGQPYVVPITYAYHEHALYCCSTVGKKVEWMRRNPAVCVEVEDIHSRQEWETVVVTGAYEELTDEPRFLDARITSFEVLAQEAQWWVPGFAPTLREEVERPIRPLFFRIVIRDMVGHRATPCAAET